MKYARWTLWALVLFASAGLVLAGCAGGPEPADSGEPTETGSRDVKKPVLPKPVEKVASKPKSKPRMPRTDEERLLALLGAERDAKNITAENAKMVDAQDDFEVPVNEGSESPSPEQVAENKAKWGLS